MSPGFQEETSTPDLFDPDSKKVVDNSGEKAAQKMVSKQVETQHI